MVQKCVDKESTGGSFLRETSCFLLFSSPLGSSVHLCALTRREVNFKEHNNVVSASRA